jgi:hypothetical protein
MPRIDSIRQGLTYVCEDLRALPLRSTNLPDPTVQRVQFVAQEAITHVEAALQQSHRQPEDFDFEEYVGWLGEVRSDLDRAATEVSLRPDYVIDHVRGIGAWASLPGDRRKRRPPRY